MNRLILFLLTIISCSSSAFAQQNMNPNVILIFMDDMGNGDLGVTGALEYQTPAIDKMANEGIRFTNFLTAQAVCSASRAGLLTGCYPNRIGISGAYGPNSKVGINADETILSELFKQKEYSTAIIGKWHLGDHEDFLPLQHGFDENFGIPYSNDMWPKDYNGEPATDWRKKNYPPLFVFEGNEKKIPINTLEDQGHLTRIYTERAVDFINRKKDNPFFLYMPHSMTHVPINASDAFKGKSKQGLYGDVMMEIDWSVNEIIKALKNNGIDKNTMIIFTSDNGPWINFGNHAGSTGGLREGKGTSYEGGHRVPCIIYWPGQIKPGISNSLSSAIDILPTLADLLDLKLPPKKIDGVSLAPILHGDMNAQPRKEFYYYYRYNSLEAVRRDDWKLVLPHPGRTYENFEVGMDGYPGKVNENAPVKQGLYDLRRDQGERYDLQNQFPDIVKSLQELADKAREDLGDDILKVEGKNRRPIGSIN